MALEASRLSAATLTSLTGIPRAPDGGATQREAHILVFSQANQTGLLADRKVVATTSTHVHLTVPGIEGTAGTVKRLWNW